MNAEVEVYYDDNGWWDRMIGEIQKASNVVLGSYLYDDQELHETLLKRLKTKKGNFTCAIVVDRQSYDERSCRSELSRLQALKLAGAQIFTCSGHDGKDIFGPKALPGFFHVKAIAIDHKIVYCGSSNFTKSSRKNVELVTRLVGPPTAKVVNGLHMSKFKGVLV